MTDVQMTLAAPSDASAKAAEVLARALDGRRMTPRSQMAQGSQASPQEGLALVEGFVAIADPELRQAILDVVAALAHRGA